MEAPLLSLLNDLYGQFRLGLVGILGLQTRFRFVNLEEEREGDVIEHPIGIDRDHPVGQFPDIANVLGSYIISGFPFFAISRFIDTQGEGSPCQCLPEQGQPSLPQLFHSEGEHRPQSGAAPADRSRPRLLGKQPGERYLSRCRLLPFCDLAKQINQGLIRLPSLRRKARENVAEVGTVERRVFVDLSREEALPQRAVWNEADAEFLEGRQHFHLRASRPQRVFALDCCDRLDGVSAANRLCSCFRKAEVLHLPFLNQVLHRSGHVFDWHVRVNTVLIEQIDGIDLESLERGLGDLLDVLWPTIQAHPAAPPVGSS